MEAIISQNPLLEASWSLLGASWEPLGCLLGPRSEKSFELPVFWVSTWEPKSTQVGSKIQEKSTSKNKMTLKRFLPIYWMLFIDSHFKARIEGFVKNNIFPKENHDSYNSEIKLKFKIRLREPFETDRFRSKKPSKLEVKIHKNRSKIEYRKLSQIFFDFCGRIAHNRNEGWGD